MEKQPKFPLRVFYDGSCAVCAREIEQYLSQDRAGRLQAVDISALDFDPAPYCISREAFMSELHVIDAAGEVYQGVAAFWAIWQAFPTSAIYGVLSLIITAPLVNPVARLLYRGFARIRAYLPQRHVCASGTCRTGRKQ